MTIDTITQEGQSMFTAVLDRIAGRVQKRRTSARERIEEAARRLAAGETIDEAGLEGAMFEAGLTVDEFRNLAVFYNDRRAKLDLLATLGNARKRLEKADAAIDAENARHAEAVDQFRKRYASLRSEADAAGAEVERARAAREWLLELANCPPSIRDDYAAALDAEQAATVAVGNAERELRRLRDEIKSEEGWIAQFTGEAAGEIAPREIVISTPKRQPLVASLQDKIDRHSQRKSRLEARLTEAEAALTAANKALAAAEAAVAAVRKRILAN
jgi:DNA repair exonuclease SbcCD ATPase subunit